MARIRTAPEDFRVEELPLYPPSGEGAHTFVQIEKRLVTTEEVASALARFAGVRARDVGYAGRKDRIAVASQWFSVPQLDPRKAIELSVRTTQNTFYTSQIDFMKDVIAQGGEMTDAFEQTHRYPDDFLDTLQTGEVAGRISESLEILAKEYEERSKLFFRMLTVAAGVIVFIAVAIVIIAMIFAIFSQYLNILKDLTP